MDYTKHQRLTLSQVRDMVGGSLAALNKRWEENNWPEGCASGTAKVRVIGHRLVLVPAGMRLDRPSPYKLRLVPQ